MKGSNTSRFIAAAGALAMAGMGVTAIPASATSVAPVAQSSVIAAIGPDHSLDVYYQAIGTQPWHPEQVAGIGTTYSPPSVQQIGNLSMIANEGPDHSLVVHWQG